MLKLNSQAEDQPLAIHPKARMDIEKLMKNVQRTPTQLRCVCKRHILLSHVGSPTRERLNYMDVDMEISNQRTEDRALTSGTDTS